MISSSHITASRQATATHRFCAHQYRVANTALALIRPAPFRLQAAASTSGSTEKAQLAQPELEAAWALLKKFTIEDFYGRAAPYLATAEKRQQIRAAVLAVYHQPYPPAGWTAAPDAEVLIGVTASSIQMAARAFRDWCQALDLPYLVPTSRVDNVGSSRDIAGGVYIKYNNRTELCYASSYTGKDRGVLLQLGGEQLGHFPLGFFDEGLKNPPAQL